MKKATKLLKCRTYVSRLSVLAASIYPLLKRIHGWAGMFEAYVSDSESLCCHNHRILPPIGCLLSCFFIKICTVGFVIRIKFMRHFPSWSNMVPASVWLAENADVNANCGIFRPFLACQDLYLVIQQFYSNHLVRNDDVKISNRLHGSEPFFRRWQSRR
jgi:hypothetical protein